MLDVYCIVRSVTYAQKGVRALERSGIPGRLLRSPRELSTGGCAYAICFRMRDLHLAEEILSRAGVAWNACYQRLPDDSFQLIAP